jgi:3-methyladenine DNA glycosylase/8-oxoguanine DNA glycosylase
MTRVEQLGSGRVVLLEASGAGTPRRPGIRIEVSHRGRLGKRDAQDIQQRVRHMFRLDEDLSGFYTVCRERGGAWIKVTAGLGRLLRSPTLFEDAVKIICTTNTQWGGTKRMVAALVEAYGEPFPEDKAKRAFPSPDKIAAADPAEFAAQARMGYRAPYVHELARRVAEGELDLDALAASGLPTAELKKQVLGIKGIGNYAAATLLMLLGRYDSLAIDSVCREFVRKKYFDGRTPSDPEIHGRYESWGEWQFLAYWFDVWQDFHGVL